MRNRKPTSTQCAACTSNSAKRETEFLAKYSRLSDAAKAYSPSYWGYALGNPERAYTAGCPALARLDTLYGRGSAAKWVGAHVTAMFMSSPGSSKGVADGIKPFADCFAAEAGRFKLSELMLFFARYKAGRYDNSYASFDARRIGNAFFKEFIPERNHELDRINRSVEQERIEKRRFMPPEGYTSLSWYRELKRRAAGGDAEAARMLTRP